MISLRKAVETHLEEAYQSTLEAYRAALGVIGDAGAKAFPTAGEQLQQSLLALQTRLTTEMGVAMVAETGQRLEAELRVWSDQAAQFYNDKTKEIKDILGIVAKAAGEIADRDERYAEHFGQLTERLHEASQLTDLSTIRTALGKSVTDINSVVTKMTKASQDSLTQLRSQLSSYEQRLHEVERLASLDALTGLANRRKVEATLERWIKEQRKFSVMYLDLNGFKKINDTLGHVAGDDLLKQFSGELRMAFRTTDVIGRWGGDEFVVAFEGDRDKALEFIPRIEKWVNGQYTLTIAEKPQIVQLSAAIGVTTWRAGESMTDVIRNADAAMYQDKSKVARVR